VVAGFGTGAESAIIAPFLAEFVPPARRGWFLGALAGFFSFGFVGAALIGRFVVPLSDSGWRWAPVVTAVPVLMVLWWHRSLPESPRYLLLRGRTAEAELVVADFERRAEASLGTALPPVPQSAAAPEPIGATAPSSPAGPRDLQRLRAPRQHHGTGDHRVLRGRARVRRRVHDDHGRPPGRGRGRVMLAGTTS
jgi:MFS family permease